MSVQVHNEGAEKWFGPQDWMSNAAGLGPGRQGSDGNTTWMFLVPVDTQSTDKHAGLLPSVLLLRSSCTINPCRAGIKVKRTRGT